MLQCMGEWEWLQETFNGPKMPKTTQMHAWEPLVKPVPYFKEQEHLKELNVINEGDHSLI